MSGPTLTIDQALQLAGQHFASQRMAEAEALGWQILAVSPEHPAALQLLAAIAGRAGAFAKAAEFAQRAIARRPLEPDYHRTLALALDRQGRFAEALTAYREAARLAPASAAVRLDLGNALRKTGDRHGTVAAFREAVRLDPAEADAQNNLGAALAELGDFPGALAAYHTAIALRPTRPGPHNNLAGTLIALGDLPGGIAACQTALALDPEFADAHINLGNARATQGKFLEAIAAYRTVIRLRPTHSSAYNNLAHALKDCGEIEEAIAGYRHALSLAPDDPVLHSNLVYALQFHPGADPAALAVEQARWNERHAVPLRATRLAHANARDPARRLRVGFVSADFFGHAIAFFLLPLLEARDRSALEVHLYASLRKRDETTERFRATADGWREVVGLSEEELAAQIRGDAIDILVDLSLHTAYHRLLTFARKPAPVQVSWLAYPGGSGLETMDWRLTDVCMEPAAPDNPRPPERPLRLPEVWCCYEPLGVFPPVGELPARAAGRVTFGSLNNFCKVSTATLETWAQLLRAVPAARLAAVCPEGPSRTRATAIFARHAVDLGRVEWLTYCNFDEYLARYGRLDVCLDPFPCNGITTTCHALWMGVPVVTLAGTLPVARAGASLLTSVGLGELVAQSAEEYVRIAAGLARDLPRLADLRATMRERMRRSPLMDAPRFARHFEAACRTMWRTWCAEGSGRESAREGT